MTGGGVNQPAQQAEQQNQSQGIAQAQQALTTAMANLAAFNKSTPPPASTTAALQPPPGAAPMGGAAPAPAQRQPQSAAPGAAPAAPAPNVAPQQPGGMAITPQQRMALAAIMRGQRQ